MDLDRVRKRGSPWLIFILLSLPVIAQIYFLEKYMCASGVFHGEWGMRVGYSVDTAEVGGAPQALNLSCGVWVLLLGPDLPAPVGESEQ